MATVKVKVAVAVDKYGEWRSWGDSVEREDRSISEALSGVGDMGVCYWIEADLPIPEKKEPEVVQATVTEA